MKKILSIALVLLLTDAAQAQQLQASNFYEMQGVLFNPSMAGTEKQNFAGAVYRTQWSAISGAPKTATVFGNFYLPRHNAGVGAYLYKDVTGPTSRTGVQASFAKHLPFRNGSMLSVGIEARFQQFAINRAKLAETLGNDPVLGGDDNQMKFDAGFGISFISKQFQAGISVSQLVQSKLNFYEGSLTRSGQARLYRHYYGHASYRWKADEATTLIPHILVTYLPNAPTEYQGGVRVEHSELLFWGLSYRARQSLMLSAGVHVQKRFTLGYSFDIYRTPLSAYDGGSNAHELILRYQFSK